MFRILSFGPALPDLVPSIEVQPG